MNMHWRVGTIVLSESWGNPVRHTMPHDGPDQPVPRWVDDLVDSDFTPGLVGYSRSFTLNIDLSESFTLNRNLSEIHEPVDPAGRDRLDQLLSNMDDEAGE